jgi:hypothetical protein
MFGVSEVYGNHKEYGRFVEIRLPFQRNRIDEITWYIISYRETMNAGRPEMARCPALSPEPIPRNKRDFSQEIQLRS